MSAVAPLRYPLLLDLVARPVLVVGGGPVAARRAARLVEAGADVHVIAPAICEDLRALAEAGRIAWLPRSAGPRDVAAGPTHAGAPHHGPLQLPSPLDDSSLQIRGSLHDRDGRRRSAPSPRRSRDLGPGADPQAAQPAAAQPAEDLRAAAQPAEDLLGGPLPASRWWLVHCATGDRAVDAAIAREAERQGVWSVRAGEAHLSAAHVPAVAVGPDEVQIAVSGGGDPGRARAVRDAIRDLLATGRLPLRRTRRPAEPIPGRDATAPTHAHAGPGSLHVPGPAEAEGSDQHDSTGSRLGSIRAGEGMVVLVGGGPGDPGLLTVAGRQWLARADVVVTDRLGPTAVLAELHPDVEVIDVGKTAGHHPIPQHEINQILVEQAQRGRTVVRLKGGDPFVLGRGGEEALHCVAHGVSVHVVPGVTSAVSVPAAAGIPVTHRGITTSMVVASAHAGARDVLAAARHAPADATLVLLMGLSSLPQTAAELIAAGRDPDTAVAVVSSGWTPRQRTVTGTLATIHAVVAEAGLASPAVTVVGEVVGLREVLGDLTGPAGGVGPIDAGTRSQTHRTHTERPLPDCAGQLRTDVLRRAAG